VCLLSIVIDCFQLHSRAPAIITDSVRGKWSEFSTHVVETINGRTLAHEHLQIDLSAKMGPDPSV
jgi:hypothetical protein